MTTAAAAVTAKAIFHYVEVPPWGLIQTHNWQEHGKVPSSTEELFD
jgi:hypothetical protein